MKTQLRRLFWFILKHFEGGEEEFTYRPMHRKILVVVGVLFLGLGAGALLASIHAGTFGYFLPVLVFIAVGLVCSVVGFLGTDRAIAKIWGNR